MRGLPTLRRDLAGQRPDLRHEDYRDAVARHVPLILEHPQGKFGFPRNIGAAPEPQPGRWPDTDLLGTFGSPEPFHETISDALGDFLWPADGDYAVSESDLPLLTYVRGFTLRQIACAARAAGVPIPAETLREAAMAEVDDFRADGSGRSAESWVLRAVAVVLVERPCPE